MANIIEYIKKIWKYGDRVTPTDLNNIETGIKNNNDAISALNSELANIKYPIKYRYNITGINYAYVRIFDIKYESYSVLNLMFIAKSGYNDMGLIHLRIRFQPDGISDSECICKGIGLTYSGSLIVSKIDNHSVSIYLYCTGYNTSVGYEILAVSSEDDVMNNLDKTACWTFYDTFPISSNVPEVFIPTQII